MLLLPLVTFVAVICSAHARGAGRAFPMHAENYAIENFQRVNPGIEWDPTNFLVDKSGWYANCNQVRKGFEHLTDFTPEGQSIGVLYDNTRGDGVDAEAVTMYVYEILDGWKRSHEYDSVILGADRFGCSVRPGCDGVVTVACLFSPGKTPLDPPAEELNDDDRVPPTQEGLAFTPQQYDMAESITGNKWDREHFLENLSGFEITCAMMDHSDWLFKDAQEIGRDYGRDVMGLKGEALNRGSTQQAMEKILRRFKSIREASNVGCSVIPDCRGGRGDLQNEMWVVVACIYEDPY